MKNNNKQVTLMAIACVSVIAVTAMVLTAMMNVAHAQDSPTRTITHDPAGFSYNFTAPQDGVVYLKSDAERRVERARKIANRTGKNQIVSGVIIRPDVTTLQGAVDRDINLTLVNDRRRLVSCAVLAVCAYRMNNNGDDFRAVRVAGAVSLNLIVGEVGNFIKRRNNLRVLRNINS